MDSTNIIRVEKNENYVVMNRTALQDKRLSWKAKGIMAYMLSMPDDWIFYMEELTKHSTDGERSFRSGFKELTDLGYVKRKPIREGQRIARWETIVYEVPLHCSFVHVEDEDVRSVHVDNVHVQNDALLSTELELSTEEELSIDNTNTFRGLFDHYLSKGIIQHSKITGPMKTAANARLKDYTYEQLIQAINNYAVIYKSSDYWFNTKYGFADLMRDKDIRKFIDDAEPFKNFASNDIQKRGGRFAKDRTSPERNDAVKSNIESANERRKRLAGIKSDRNPNDTI